LRDRVFADQRELRAVVAGGRHDPSVRFHTGDERGLAASSVRSTVGARDDEMLGEVEAEIPWLSRSSE